MMQKNKTQNVVVTGGSRGIGLAIAGAFAKRGSSVLLVARDSAELKRAQKSITGKVYICVADVSKQSSGKKVRSYIKKYLKDTVDILVNAAGIYGPKGFLEENNLLLWEKTIAVNLLGTVIMCAHILPLMKRKKFGRIINFSGGGEGSFPRFTAYSASKGAIVRFTESLAAEVGSGITVNAIAPGAVNTKLMEEVLTAGPKRVGAEFYKKSLEQKRSGGTSPDKAAELVVFLAGKRGDNLSGRIFSAVHDRHDILFKKKKEIMNSDIYTFRRVKPKDRGYEW